MDLRGFILAAGVLSAVITPTAASAQSCSSMYSENERLKREALALTKYEWGSALVFGGCVAAGMSQYNSTQSEAEALTAVALCATGGCGFTTDYQNCLKVNATLFLYALRGTYLEDEMRRRCEMR